MSSVLNESDIDQIVASSIYTQDYSPKQRIDGVRIVPLKNFVGEEGDFSEIMRITAQGEVEGLEGFKVAQINRTLLLPNSLKAWHLHLRQDEVWYVSPHARLMVGLWDVRSQSATKGKTMRIVLGAANSHMLFIPKGVAHGYMNHGDSSVELYYFTSEQFNKDNPDEKRIAWDAKGKDFWQPLRD